MSEMVDRVADALWKAESDSYEDMARAAIAAMREPTDRMKSAGGFYHIRGALPIGKGERGLAADAYRAMIDEALREE